jgi:peptide/nickel transport system permease protein
MARYLLRRVILAVPVLLLVSMITFFGQFLLPGDPLVTLFGANFDAAITAEQVEELRHEHGLDQPAPVQYVRWLSGVVRGDFGMSISAHAPVKDLVFQKLSVSIWLTSTTLILNVFIGIVLGVVAGILPGGKVDFVATLIASWGVATPNFWLAILLILFFALKLGWFPASGWGDPMADPIGAIRFMVLPVLALGLFGSASIMRQTRSSILEVMSQDYMTTARAKGLAPREVIVRHGLRNALIPIITVAAFQVSGLIGGSVLVERVFAIPGFGRLAVEAMQTNDFPVVQMVVLLSAVAVIAANLLADVLYAVADPRIRYE